MGLPLSARIARLEAEGVTLVAFMDAWEAACRRRLAGDPDFNGAFLSGGAWGLAALKPAWKQVLHERLVGCFLEPWLEDFFQRYEGVPEATASLRWKGAVRTVDREGARHWLRIQGLIPEINRLDLELPPGHELFWAGAPPVSFRVTGRFSAIRQLARPSALELIDCPDLREITELSLVGGPVRIHQCPNLCLSGGWSRTHPPRLLRL